MLSILNRRVVVTSMTRPLVRSYTIIPSMPAQPISVTEQDVKKNDTYNAVHALYNNENQSIHESHLSAFAGQTYRSLSSDDHSSTFGPTFNSVFDE